ncbi:MAG: magnesium transporter [Alphaproteobacteria bacterium]|nr:magnesium transporter [Alphaproteobacteria bacterium]
MAQASNSWDRVRELANAEDPDGLRVFLSTLEPNEAVRAILRLNADEQGKVLTTLSPDDAADLIEDIPDEQAADIVEQLEPKAAANIVNRMESDEQADLLGDMEDEDAEAILQEMEPEEANDARMLASYADDVAGGLMKTEFLSYREDSPVGKVIDDLSARAEEIEPYFNRYIYATSPWGRLVGVLSARQLLLHPKSQPIAKFIVPALFVKAEEALDDLKTFFDTHALSAAPVVDAHGQLLGVVRRTSVHEALEYRAEQEMLRMGGIIGGDEIRTLPVLERSRRRLSWLSINIVLNVLAASVIALYIDTLSAVIALAIFIPIVSDMSGCTGNQAVAVSMRELSLGIVKPFEVFRVWLKEVSVGLINGSALGLILGLGAWAWKGNPYLGLVVGGAMALNTLIAVSIGGTVPLLLKRWGVDPAIASGPILTTVTDICGFFLLLSLAALMLDKLI